MRSTLSAQLNLEAMESRALPSSTALAPATPVIGPPAFLSTSLHDQWDFGHHHHDHGDGGGKSMPVAQTSAKTALSGWLAGQVQMTLSSENVDAGSKYSLSGKAMLAGLGEVTVEGYVQGTGFIAHGHATGQLKLTEIGDPSSTITVDLTGPLQGGLAALPSSWTIHVVSATGSFAKIHGHTPMTLNIAMSSTTPDQGIFRGSI